MSETSFSKDTPDKLDLEECVSKLNFISNIPENNKPCYNTNTCIAKNAWFVRIRRRWAGEEGEEGVEYVSKVLDSCDRNYRMCLSQQDVNKLYLALENSVSGFDNLIKTYTDQSKVQKGYIECKKRVNELMRKIKQARSEHNKPKPPKPPKRLLSYFSGWGGDDEDDYDNYDYDETEFDTKKKSMSLSLVISEKSSSKTSFFGANDMVLLKPSSRNNRD